MKAVRWYGKEDVRVENVPDPKIEDPRDAIIQITASGICGSDLHLYDDLMPTMQKGDVLGHEPMGVVVETGSAVKNLKKGDRVVVPFTISCGECFFCRKGLFSLCDVSNPNAEMAKKVMGQSPAGLFGYSHLMGGFPGGQAQYLRVPFADFGPLKIESDLRDEQVVFLSDIFPTGYMAAENCGIEPGDTVAVWGCGPVGQFAIKSAWMLGAGRVIAIDNVPERLRMAETQGKAETIVFGEKDPDNDTKTQHVYHRLMEMTKGRGPDRCIDAVGTEAHAGGSIDALLDRAKVAMFLGTDRAHVLREVVFCCRKGGTISVPGVYIGVIDKFPFGAAMNKGLTFRMGQTHMHRYMKPLLERIQRGEIDPSFVITHEVKIQDAPAYYKKFRDKKDGCIKVVIKPNNF
ncbi:MAG TPA: zinc-dependent alcohol dehydrogenase [Candidatus Sulfotelmatobacter sp.]|nr:zinc-dependent alcohol dehydrogenase [Candidatus Sulfotelmatobacter sp.]